MRRHRVQFRRYTTQPADCAHCGGEFEAVGAQTGDEVAAHILHCGLGLLAYG